MQTFKVENLPEVDQREIKRSLCPWCLVRLVDDGETESEHVVRAKRRVKRIAGFDRFERYFVAALAVGVLITMGHASIICAYTRPTCSAFTRSAVWTVADAIQSVTGYAMVVYTRPDTSVQFVREEYYDTDR